MKSKLLLVIATIALALLTLPVVAMAQQAPTAVIDSAMGSAAPVLLSGTYRGDVNRTNGDNAFKLVLEQNGSTIVGTLQFWKADPKCRQQVSITGTMDDSGVATVQAPGAFPECGRTLMVTVAASGEIGGELKGPMGLSSFTLVKQKQ